MIPEFLSGLGLVEAGALAAASVVGLYLLAGVALAWLKRLVVRLAFRHVAFAGVSAVGGTFVDRLTDGGLSTVLDVALGLVGFG